MIDARIKERNDRGVYLELTSEAGDMMVVKLLSHAKEGVETDIARIASQAGEMGLKPHHQEDLRDHFETIDAMERVIKYFGG